MDELTLLRELGEEIDRTAGAPSPRTRHRVVTGIAAGRPGDRMSARRRLLPVGGALLAGGLAASVALAVGGPTGLGLGGDDRGAGVAAGGGVDGGAGVAAGGGVDGGAGGDVDARTILLAAARTARETPTSVPDPKAFVYTRTKERGMAGRYAAGKEDPAWVSYSSTREAWLSVDGSRDGAVTPSGSTELVEIPAHGTTPAYQADLPATAAAMKDHLYRDAGKGQKSGDDAVAFEAGRALAQESYLPSPVRAALFEAMAAIPGVEYVDDAVNVAGERGVAVAFSRGGHRDELLFDPDSHRVIGTRTVFVGQQAGLPPGSVMYTSAVLESAVVDRVRERPDGTLREGPIDDGEKKGIVEKERAAEEAVAGEPAKPTEG
jgi:hypothetical protein